MNQGSNRKRNSSKGSTFLWNCARVKCSNRPTRYGGWRWSILLWRSLWVGEVWPSEGTNGLQLSICRRSSRAAARTLSYRSEDCCENGLVGFICWNSDEGVEIWANGIMQTAGEMNSEVDGRGEARVCSNLPFCRSVPAAAYKSTLTAARCTVQAR